MYGCDQTGSTGRSKSTPPIGIRGQMHRMYRTAEPQDETADRTTEEKLLLVKVLLLLLVEDLRPSLYARHRPCPDIYSIYIHGCGSSDCMDGMWEIRLELAAHAFHPHANNLWGVG